MRMNCREARNFVKQVGEENCIVEVWNEAEHDWIDFEKVRCWNSTARYRVTLKERRKESKVKHQTVIEFVKEHGLENCVVECRYPGGDWAEVADPWWLPKLEYRARLRESQDSPRFFTSIKRLQWRSEAKAALAAFGEENCVVLRFNDWLNEWIPTRRPMWHESVVYLTKLKETTDMVVGGCDVVNEWVEKNGMENCIVETWDGSKWYKVDKADCGLTRYRARKIAEVKQEKKEAKQERKEKPMRRAKRWKAVKTELLEVTAALEDAAKRSAEKIRIECGQLVKGYVIRIKLENCSEWTMEWTSNAMWDDYGKAKFNLGGYDCKDATKHWYGTLDYWCQLLAELKKKNLTSSN